MPVSELEFKTEKSENHPASRSDDEAWRSHLGRRRIDDQRDAFNRIIVVVIVVIIIIFFFLRLYIGIRIGVGNRPGSRLGLFL